jgi:hypothetical protein
LRDPIAEIHGIQKRGGCQAERAGLCWEEGREQGYTLVTGVEFREIKREVATTTVLR